MKMDCSQSFSAARASFSRYPPVHLFLFRGFRHLTSHFPLPTSYFSDFASNPHVLLVIMGSMAGVPAYHLRRLYILRRSTSFHHTDLQGHHKLNVQPS